MRADQVSLDITDTDLTASCFQIDRRSWRHLNLEFHVAHSTTIAIIRHYVDDQSCISLSGVEMYGRGFHRSGDADFIPCPGLNGDRPGEVLQLNADVLPGRIVTRHSLLGEGVGIDHEYEKEGRKGCKTYSVPVSGRIKVHRWIIKRGTHSAFQS